MLRSSSGLLIRFLSLVVIVVMLSGCQRVASGVSTSLIQGKEPAFKRIAVLPFQKANPEDFAKNAAATGIPASIIRTRMDPSTPERTVENLFWEKLMAAKRFDLVSPDRVEGIFEQVTSTSFKMSLPEAIQKVGAELEADGLIVGYVYRFRERRGYDYAAEKPASVSFEIQLYRCQDGVLVWKGFFDKTQKSLMEDMLSASYFVKDRGKWITAKELTSQGMDDTLKKFPGLLKTED